MESTKADYEIFVDGAINSKGQFIGIHILEFKTGKSTELFRKIGASSHNIAEYHSLVLALDWIKNNVKNGMLVSLKTDSRLIFNQVFGTWRCGFPDLYPFWKEAKLKIAHLNCTILCEYVSSRSNLADDVIRRNIN